MPPKTNLKTRSNSPFPALIFILIATFFVYLPSLQNGFITSWDDNHFVTENSSITSLSIENIKHIFSTTLLNMYSPLTTLSLAIDYSFFELKPFGYHLSNLIFHLINTLLVFGIFTKITNKNWVVFFITSMFAIHPMHVESVAWISERKDVLYSLFYLSAIYTYLKYIDTKQNKHFLFTIILFICSCLAKPMAITLPIILALIQWYKDENEFKLNKYIPVLSLLIISISIAIIPFLLHDLNTLSDDLSTKFNFVDRIFLLTYSISFYFIKTILPIQQSAFHYYPEKINDLLPSVYYLSILIIPILIIAFIKLKSIRKELIFTILFFLISISLVLKIFPFGNAVVAERYTYLPYLGLFYGLGLCIDNLIISINIKNILIIIITCVFAIISFNRLKVWKNNVSLFTDIINKYPETPIPYNIRGDAYSQEDNQISAINDYTKAITLDPSNFEAYINRGVSLFKTNQFQLAVADYNSAEKLKNNIPKLYINRGTCHLKLNQYDLALNDFKTVIKTEPKNNEALSNIGLCYYNLKKYNEALNYYNQAIDNNPNDFETLKNRGNAKAFLKDFKGSIEDYSVIINANPQDANALSNRGNSYFQNKQLDKACADWKISAQLGNTNAIGASNAFCR